MAKWRDVSTAEIWTFLGIVILMGIKRLPRISNYWSRDSFIGVPGMNQYMSVTRFWAVWSNLHIVDNESIVASSGLSRKIQPKDLLAFRLELVHLLLEEVGLPKEVRQSSASVGRAQSERVCYLEKVSKIGLKWRRCRHCQLKNRKLPRSSSFGCGVCKVRLCMTTCFAEFHRH